MLSHNQLKYFSSLRNKKFREEYGRFLAEGEKVVSDLLEYSQCILKAETILCLPEFLEKHDPEKLKPGIEVIPVSEKELSRISSFSTPNQAILICRKPDYSPDFGAILNELSVFLDDISDPGNLGTIIRTADWFGIRNIFCTHGSVELYNPKVIQSSMGSVCRVRVHYINADELQKVFKKNGYKIFGMVLNGENIYTQALPSKGMIILGNESKGISADIQELIGVRLTIPPVAEGREKTDSLNIAAAAAVIFSEFRRQNYSK